MTVLMTNSEEKPFKKSLEKIIEKSIKKILMISLSVSKRERLMHKTHAGNL